MSLYTMRIHPVLYIYVWLPWVEFQVETGIDSTGLLDHPGSLVEDEEGEEEKRPMQLCAGDVCTRERLEFVGEVFRITNSGQGQPML